MAFGLTNATLTEIYSAASSSRDVYGSMTLGTPTTSIARVFIEETSSDRRQVGGDSHARTARLFAANNGSVLEGDVITVAPDSRTSLATRKWRVAGKNTFHGPVVQRMELDLEEESN